MPEHYLKLLPKYNAGEQDISAEEHMDKFQNFINDMLIEEDDAYMRFFLKHLKVNQENGLELFLQILLILGML